MTETGLTRRHALLFAMGGAALGSGVSVARALEGERIALPAEPMVLTRRLTRGLRDDAVIVVTRRWRITFARQARGIAVNGEQIEVTVEAPPQLAQLSAIEEARPTTGLFPILLGPDGAIMAAGDPGDARSVDAALLAAQRVMAQHGLSADSVAQHALYMAQLQQAGSSLLDEWPADLFYPSPSARRIVRQIALPDGGTGDFELRWQATPQAGSALLNEARREVLTRIGESERRSSEEWSLAPG